MAACAKDVSVSLVINTCHGGLLRLLRGRFKVKIVGLMGMQLINLPIEWLRRNKIDDLPRFLFAGVHGTTLDPVCG